MRQSDVQYGFEDEDEDFMPVPCQRCNKIFDLNDGFVSEKWYPNTVICRTCNKKEEEEIEQEDEIEECLSAIEDAKWTINNCVERLRAVGYNTSEIQ